MGDRILENGASTELLVQQRRRASRTSEGVMGSMPMQCSSPVPISCREPLYGGKCHCAKMRDCGGLVRFASSLGILILFFYFNLVTIFGFAFFNLIFLSLIFCFPFQKFVMVCIFVAFLVVLNCFSFCSGGNLVWSTFSCFFVCLTQHHTK